ncbi:MAG: PKD domain-containing protein [Bacteroidetes bacterium]|nr:PKD domain-containing protein [Bacteroidota bacterium]
MKRLFYRSFILFSVLYTVFGGSVFAQSSVFYMSKGTTGPVSAGETLPYTDFWFRPGAGAAQTSVEIFDAALGGPMDILSGQADTKTTFELIAFDQVYRVTESGLQPLSGNPQITGSQTFSTEPEYLNRWLTFSKPLTSGGNGWILRVRAGDGNDVNSYNLRLAGNGSGWETFAVNLSIGISGIRDNQEVQFLPDQKLNSDPVPLTVAGEEDSPVSIKDGTGKNLSLSDPASSWDPTLNGRRNQWGVVVKNTKLKVNNLTITGSSSPVVFGLPATVVTIPVQPVYTIKADYIGDCTRFRLTLMNRGKPVTNPGTIHWTMDGQQESGNPVEVDFGNPGKKQISVLIETEAILIPAYWTAKTEINVNASPVAQLSAPSKRIGTGEVLLLSAGQSTDPDGDPLTFQWLVNGATAGSGTPFPFSSTFPGTYTVKLIVTDQSDKPGCATDSREVTVTVNAQPFTEISFPAVQATGTQNQFKTIKTADGDADKLSFSWSGPGVTGSSNGETVSILHEKPGTYTVNLSVNDNQGTPNSVYQTSATYRSNAEPEPRFTLPVQSAPGVSLSLNGSLTTDADSRDLVYTWLISDGRRLSGPMNSIQFKSPGDYSLTLQVDDQENVENSVQEITRKIHINYPPQPVITAEDVSPESYQEFSAKRSSDADQSIVKYKWSFGDGSTAEGIETDHRYEKTGKYTITLSVDDGQNQPNSIQSVTHDLIIVKFPIARFDLIEKTEPGSAVSLDGSESSDPDGSVSKYEWKVNGTVLNRNAKTEFTPVEPGVYTISLTVTDDSGFDVSVNTLSKTVAVNYPPVPKSIISPFATAPGQTVTFDATPSIDPDGSVKTASWQFGDGSVLTGMKVTKSFASSGQQSVVMTVSDGTSFSNGKTAETYYFLINTTPIIVTQPAIRQNSRSVRLDASGSYDPDGDPVQLEWILPGGEKRSEAAFNWQAPSGGLHLVSLVARDNNNLPNSITTQKIEIKVNRPPQAKVDTLIIACTGQTILFNGSASFDPDGDGLTTEWDFADGTKSTETNPAKVYFSPGFYQVKLSLSDGFSEQPTVATIPVIIKGSPVAKLAFSDTTICVGTLLTLDGGLSTDPNGPIGAYTWDFGNGDRDLGQVVNYIFKEKGVFNLSLTVVGTPTGNCSNVSQTSARVTVIEGPKADFTFEPWVSVGETVVFDAGLSSPQDAIANAEWVITDLDKSVNLKGEKVTYAFEKPGFYTIRLVIKTESKTDCNMAFLEKKIRVNAAPEIAWSVPDSVMFGSYLDLDASRSSDADGVVAEFDWVVNGKSIGKEPKVSIPVNQPGKLVVSLTVRDDSPTSSKRTTKTKTVLVNQSPVPNFIVPAVVYAGELLSLTPATAKDADGDNLTSTWTAGSTPFTGMWTVKDGNEILTLTQDDGRGFKNSRQSWSVRITGIPAPEVLNPFPARVITGTVIQASSLRLPKDVFLLDGGRPVSSIELRSAGTSTVQLGWKPKQEVLKTWPFQIVVFEPIRFVKTHPAVNIIWNPGNPSISLSAPALNRTDLKTTEIRWSNGTSELGKGTELTVPLKKGVNRFILKARDLDIPGSPAGETVIEVTCE